MFKIKMSSSVVVGLGAGAMLLMALPAFAATTNINASANAATRLATLITKANADIGARITDLNKLNTRVQAMKNESATEKANISTQVQTNITGLTALQTKIDADTTLATARTDAATIFTTFRIYALVVPQGDILAAADRVTTIDGLMTALGTKMQTRITADQSAGKDVSALTAAMTDINARIADAATQSQTAQSGVINLVPDQGDKTTATSNHAALLAARANIKTSTADLQAARQDIKTILAGLKTLGKN
jgi:hypothetical protein